MRKIVMIVAGVLILGGFVLYRNQRALERHRELVFRKASDCQRGIPDFGQFSAQVEESRELPQLRLAEIAHQIPRLRAGMTFSQTEELLGEPNFVDAQLPKDGDEYYGCNWNYVLDGNVAESRLTLIDRLELEFDESDHLRHWSREDNFGNLKK